MPYKRPRHCRMPSISSTSSLFPAVVCTSVILEDLALLKTDALPLPPRQEYQDIDARALPFEGIDIGLFATMPRATGHPPPQSNYQVSVLESEANRAIHRSHQDLL